MTIYDLKPAFQNLLRPVTRGLYRAGVTANQVTLAALLLSAATGAWLAWRAESSQALLAMPVVLFVRMALNAIDGMLAREHNQKSRLGAILNELGDILSDSALYLPLALHQGFNGGLVAIAVLLAVSSEMTGVLGLTVGASRRYDGPMGKSDRAFVFGAVSLALGLGVKPGLWINIVMGATAALLGLTIWNRARRALKEAG